MRSNLHLLILLLFLPIQSLSATSSPSPVQLSVDTSGAISLLQPIEFELRLFHKGGAKDTTLIRIKTFSDESKLLVESMEGQLDFVSSPGQSTVIRFRVTPRRFGHHELTFLAKCLDNEPGCGSHRTFFFVVHPNLDRSALHTQDDYEYGRAMPPEVFETKALGQEEVAQLQLDRLTPQEIQEKNRNRKLQRDHMEQFPDLFVPLGDGQFMRLHD